MAVPPCGFVGTTTFLVEVGLGVLDARGVLVHLISPVAVKVGVQSGVGLSYPQISSNQSIVDW